MIDITLPEHQGLVHFVIKRMKSTLWAKQGVCTQYDDIFQAGCIGLMKAAKKFDPNRGVKFATYAQWWVRAAIGRYIYDEVQTVRVPVHARQKGFKTGNKTWHKPLSLDREDENGLTLLDQIASEDIVNEFPDQYDDLRLAIDSLPDRLKTLIKLRFYQNMTLGDIASIFGLTRERIRQLEEKALWQLRSAIRSSTVQAAE